MEAFIGAAPHGRVALGPSSSQLLAALGSCYSRLLGPGDEVVVQEACHEANVGPWVRCAEDSGARLRWWKTDLTPDFSRAPDGADSSGAGGDGDGSATGGALLRLSLPCPSLLSDLRPLLSERTRVVAVTHVSNLLGGVADVARLVALVREAAPRARIVVDGVAYAPHRLVDVGAWGVDWYALSVYKVWGPHAAALYGSHDAFRELGAARGPNHFWIPPSDPSYWFELGGVSHEACAGITAIGDYLRLLAGANTAACAGSAAAGGTAVAGGSAAVAVALQGAGDGTAAGLRAVASRPKGGAAGRQTLQRAEVVAAFGVAGDLEAPLAAPIIQFLSGHPNTILVGPGTLEGRRPWKAGPGGQGGAAAEGGCGWDGHGWVGRVPTISFVHIVKPSRQVAREMQERGYAIRSGHAFARRLVKALVPAIAPYLRREGGRSACTPHLKPGSDSGGAAAASEAGNVAEGALGGGVPEGCTAAVDEFVEDGVVRISLLHYNSPQEVNGLLAALREVL